MILSRLDYANSLLLGAPEGMLDRLQIVQNNAARVIHRKSGVISCPEAITLVARQTEDQRQTDDTLL